MKAILDNVVAVVAAIEHGDFCDVGHYYCPTWRDNRYVFPSGAVLYPEGLFKGPKRLYETLVAIPSDYDPKPIPPHARYPVCCENRRQGLGCPHGTPRRACACGSGY